MILNRLIVVAVVYHVVHSFNYFYELSFQAAKCAISVEVVNDTFTDLKGKIAGPPDTPYEGGNFILEIKVPETYPFNPPKVFHFMS